MTLEHCLLFTRFFLYRLNKMKFERPNLKHRHKYSAITQQTIQRDKRLKKTRPYRKQKNMQNNHVNVKTNKNS